MSEKKVVDWDLVGLDYRAGIKTLRQIGEEHGVSHTYVKKRADKEGWTRDLSKRIQEKAKELVNRGAVSDLVNTETKATEQAVVAAVAQKVADIDLANRGDLQIGLDVIRGLTQELAALSNPEFKEQLVWLGKLMDDSYMRENGSVVQDKVNLLYQAIIELPTRFKMAKDLASAVGVYIPLQRKVVGLDAEKAASDVDDLLLKIAREKGMA